MEAVSLNLFLDTNVIVGYSIECDPWNYYSKRLFDKFDSFYWSSTVEEETNCVIDKLLYFYSVFFDKVKDCLNQFEFNKSEFFKIFESVTHVDGKKIPFKQRDLASLVWEDGGWYSKVSSSTICDTLDVILDNLNNDAFINLEDCTSRLNPHIRVNKYHDLLNNLRSLEVKDGNNSIHSPDDYIVLDAHDLAKNDNLFLMFVTADLKLLAFSEDILKLTNIKDMVFLEKAYFIS